MVPGGSTRFAGFALDLARSAAGRDGAFEAIEVQGAGELLSGFEAVTRFPRGTVGDPPEPFQLAMFQDVYLARRPA